MDRRALLVGSAAIAVSSSARAAEMALGMPTPMGIPKRSWVAHPLHIQQQCPQWCWAASAAMIFSSHGHTIDQKKIVQKVFGGLDCAPSGNSLTISRVLSDSWIDDNNQEFQSKVVAAYDPANRIGLENNIIHANGIVSINNSIIVDELRNDKLLLYANSHHAMVVMAVEYYDTPVGPNIQSVGVLDPWPLGPSFHPLSPLEMVPVHLGGQMTFLATVRIV